MAMATGSPLFCFKSPSFTRLTALFHFFTCRKEDCHTPEGGQEDLHAPEGGKEDRHAPEGSQEDRHAPEGGQEDRLAPEGGQEDCHAC